MLVVVDGFSRANIIHRRDIAQSPTPDERREKLIDDYKARFANPYTAAERGYIDDVASAPYETRPKVITAFETLLTKRVQGPSASTATSRCEPAAAPGAARLGRLPGGGGRRDRGDRAVPARHGAAAGPAGGGRERVGARGTARGDRARAEPRPLVTQASPGVSGRSGARSP